MSVELEVGREELIASGAKGEGRADSTGRLEEGHRADSTGNDVSVGEGGL